MARMTGFLAVIIFLFCAGPGNAGQWPVAMTHKLIGDTSQGASTDLEYSLHVVNIGSGALSNVRLSLVPSPRMTKSSEIVVGTLAPGQGTDVRFRLRTWAKPDRYRNPRLPLWWSGKAVDAAGYTIEFPVTSTAEVSHE